MSNIKNRGASNLLKDDEILSSSISEILQRYETSVEGLTAEGVANRLEIYGSNEVSPKGKVSVPIKFLLHFKSPLTIILLVAAIISGVLGQIENTIIIFVIVLVSVILDFFQEYRAEKAADELRKRVASTATTLRNGTKQDIDVSELVPGDIIFLSSGDIVPADARVMVSKDLFIDQSALTGESFPAEKTADPITRYQKPRFE